MLRIFYSVLRKLGHYLIEISSEKSNEEILRQSKQLATSLVSREERPPICTMADIEIFEHGRVWRDLQELLKARISGNFNAFTDLAMDVDGMRQLQGSTAELYTMLELPSQLRAALPRRKETEDGSI